jgi:hypothetical protein
MNEITFLISFIAGCLGGYALAKNHIKKKRERQRSDQLYWEYMRGERTLGTPTYITKQSVNNHRESE